LVDFHEIWYGDDAIQGDLNAIILNSIASTILKWLRFEFVRKALLNSGLELFSTVTTGTKASNLPNAVEL
jgi:hypothetical protein